MTDKPRSNERGSFFDQMNVANVIIAKQPIDIKRVAILATALNLNCADVIRRVSA
jgi:hypothetical protein